MEKLKHLIWTCTRAEERKYAYSLGDGKASPNELTTNEARMLIDKAADFGVECFFITGGEPFIREDLLEIVKYASERGLPPYIKTSGWKLDSNIIEELASSNCKIIISIAGLKETDELLRGKGAYERSINAARLCAKEGILSTLSVVNTKNVVNQIRDLVYLALHLGAKSLNLASLIPQALCVKEQLEKLGPLEPNAQEHEKELEEIYALSKELRNKINIMAYDMCYNRILKQHEPSLELNSRCCLCHNVESNEWLDILDDGKAYACSPLGLMFGDIRKDSIEEIMNRIHKSDIIKELADRKNLKGKCGICEYNLICGGCRAKAYIYSGDMFGSDPLCSHIPKKQVIE